MKKHYLYLVIFIALAVVVLGGVYFFKQGFPGERADVVVDLKWKHQAQFAGMYVAREKGYYRQGGLNVEVREFNFESSPSENLINNEADFALMSAEEFLLLIDRGYDVRALAAIYQNSPYSIVSLAAKNITTPADFLGKTLGNKGGKEEEELFYLLLMEEFGISVDDVEIKDLGFGKREIDDLLDGDADTVGLYRTDQLYFFEEEGVDYNIIYPEQFGVNISNDILVARGDFVDNKASVVAAFVGATIDGWNYAIENQEEAVAITMDYVVDENYNNQAYEEYILKNSIPLIQPNSARPIGVIRHSSLVNLYAIMQKNGFLNSNFDVEDYYTNNFID